MNWLKYFLVKYIQSDNNQTIFIKSNSSNWTREEQVEFRVLYHRLKFIARTTWENFILRGENKTKSYLLWDYCKYSSSRPSLPGYFQIGIEGAQNFTRLVDFLTRKFTRKIAQTEPIFWNPIDYFRFFSHIYIRIDTKWCPVERESRTPHKKSFTEKDKEINSTNLSFLHGQCYHMNFFLICFRLEEVQKEISFQKIQDGTIFIIYKHCQDNDLMKFITFFKPSYDMAKSSRVMSYKMLKIPTF